MKARTIQPRNGIAYYLTGGSVFRIEEGIVQYFCYEDNRGWSDTWWNQGMVKEGKRISESEAKKLIEK